MFHRFLLSVCCFWLHIFTSS